MLRLHYHKRGNTDEPTYVGPKAFVLPGLQQPPVAAGGAAQPAGDAVVATVGRNEASAALQTLVH